MIERKTVGRAVALTSGKFDTHAARMVVVVQRPPLVTIAARKCRFSLMDSRFKEPLGPKTSCFCSREPGGLLLAMSSIGTHLFLIAQEFMGLVCVLNGAL